MLPVTEFELDEFLAAFEGGTLPKVRWTHAAHLLTGACYVHGLGVDTAMDKMRLCVKCYNVAVGGENTETSGYHETITIAWIKLLGRLLREAQASGPITARSSLPSRLLATKRTAATCSSTTTLTWSAPSRRAAPGSHLHSQVSTESL